jgi:hypothetical protein
MQSMVREDTESISFRVNKEMLDKLRAEADVRRLSTNSLAIQIFSDYIAWHIAAQRAGFIAITAKFVSKLLENVEEEEIARIAREFATNGSKEVLLILRNECSMESMLDVVETWARVCGYTFKVMTKDSRTTYVIQHNMGRKWSILIRELLSQIYEDFGRPSPIFDISDNIVSYRTEQS